MFILCMSHHPEVQQQAIEEVEVHPSLLCQGPSTGLGIDICSEEILPKFMEKFWCDGFDWCGWCDSCIIYNNV